MTTAVADRAEGLDLARRRAALSGARAALSGLAAVLGSAADRDLPELLTELDEVAALAGAGRVAVTAEAVARGAVAASQARSVAGWVATHAPSQRAGGAGAVAKVAEAFGAVEHGPVREAVLAGEVSPQVAASVVDEFDRLRPGLVDAAAPDVLRAMLTVGAEHGIRGVREVRPTLLARFGAAGQLQSEQNRARRLVSLSRPRPDLPGTVAYALVLDAEGQAVLEAAIGPLSKPVPGPEGEPDPSPADRRRAEALVDVCRRTTAAAAAADADGRVPPMSKATLLLTMTLDDLTSRTGAATTMGTTEAGMALAPETARRIACDAGVVPAVLGSRSEMLELGQRLRLFTLGQVRALWLRDRGCTFPGCGAPAFWCDAHHLRHWVDGGPTGVTNGALLCARHHTVVHRDRLAGWATAEGVVWDQDVGSYDRLLARSVASGTPRADGARPEVHGPRGSDTDDPPLAGRRGPRGGDPPGPGDPTWPG